MKQNTIDSIAGVTLVACLVIIVLCGSAVIVQMTLERLF